MVCSEWEDDWVGQLCQKRFPVILPKKPCIHSHSKTHAWNDWTQWTKPHSRAWKEILDNQRKTIGECVVCRQNRAKIREQKMDDLTLERLEPELPPFTNVGVDYFGPTETKRGRTTLKRYGMLFTCMTSSAVHTEVANSLDTDSCRNALRGFICWRGQIKHIRSDNGTKFVGAKS